MEFLEPDVAARRGYWAGQLEEAYGFMMRVLDCPVAECGEPLASLADAARKAGVEVAFSDRPHVHGRPRNYLLREGLIAQFVDAARRLNHRGWILRVEDGYRDLAMQKALGLQPCVFDVVLRKVTWELEGQTPDPAFLLKRLLTLVAQIPATGTHMTGSAIDISVLDRSTGEEVDRGGPYLEMSERTPMNSPFVGPQAGRNRQEITATLRDSGFVEYPFEFWHYSSGDAYDQCLRGTDQPARYGAVDLDVTTGRVTPIDDPRKSLNSLDDIRAAIQAALHRNRASVASAQDANQKAP